MLKTKASSYFIVNIICVPVIVVAAWLACRNTSWLTLVIVTVWMWIYMCGQSARQLLLEDDVLKYRTLTRGTIFIRFSDIRQIKNESGWDNGGEFGSMPVSRLLIQRRSGDEISIGLGAFSDDAVALFCESLKRKCQERGVPYAKSFL